MTGRWRLFNGVAPLALLLANVTAVVPAHADACTAGGVVDAANGTTCSGGSTDGQLTYVESNGNYQDGDFTLTLDNHNVTADTVGGAIEFDSTVDGDGTIILENGSAVTNTADFGDGIRAFAFDSAVGENLTITVLDTSSVSGHSSGISAFGAGNIKVTTAAGATVTGIAGFGISADAGGDVELTTNGAVTGGVDGISAEASGNIIITTNAAVTGGRDGINAESAASIFVTANGNVGGGEFGIAALSTGGLFNNVNITTGVNSFVTGATHDGIQAIAEDSVTVTVNGTVDGQQAGVFAHGGNTTVTTGKGSQIGGTTGDGINAVGDFGTAVITTGVDSAVAGGNDGINALSDVSDVTVTTGANASVTGAAGDGIDAQSAAFGDVTVNIGALSRVRGAIDGILARGTSDGVTVTLEAGALVTGGARGIAALNDAGNVLVRTGAGSEVIGTGSEGIIATSAEGGTVAVALGANSVVSGGNDGVFAESLGGGGAVSVGADAGADVNGDIDGIDARSVSGALSIATGAGSGITGIGGAGIRATSGSGVVTISTGEDSKISGAGEGIAVSTRGAGTITITNNGETVGSGAGIEAASETGAIRINNTGTITNLSRDPDDLAIRLRGGPATIDNDGIIRGRIDTSGSSSSFELNNTGIWTTNGASDFAGSNDTVNNRAVIFAGGDAGVAETMNFAGLETLNNSGRIDLRDRLSNAGNTLSDRLQTTGDYVGLNGAVLAVDAFLADPKSVSDVLAVGGSTSGVTSVLVNNTNLGPAVFNPDGILVVDVAGTAHEGDFVLTNGPVDTGFFIYDLVFNNADQDNDQFLLMAEADNDVFETLATVASSQEIWRETASAWETRQQAVRDRLSAGVMVTAVADPALPGSIAPENGLWFSALGSWTARDARISGFDLDYDQSIYGFVAGADFGIDLGGDGSLLFGLLAGYVDSSLNFDASPTSIKTDGATIGVYTSLLDGGFFANLLVQADLLNLNYSAPALGPDNSDDADVTSFGARADIGYRFDAGDIFIEPMLSADAISTTIDEFSVGGADIDAGTNESFRAGAGLRAGVVAETVRASVTGRIWNVFATDNEAAFTPDGPVIALSDDTLEGVYGEVSGQVDVDLSEGTLLFVKGGVVFSDDITKPSVSGGFNFSW